MTATSHNVWDSLPLNSQNSSKLFGNANVGCLNLTNLQVAGNFTYSGTVFFVQRWYARTDFQPTNLHGWDRISHNMTATFVLGNKYTWQLSIAELLARRPRADAPFHPRDPWPLEIPDRLNAQVSIDRFGVADGADWNAFLGGEDLIVSPAPWATGHPRIWIHFEGVVADGDDAMHLRKELARRLRAYQSAEENIADYILSLAPGADESTLGTLNAVRDGILDGRSRPR